MKVIPALVIAAFFLARAWPGLFVDFQPDDLMNMHGAWQQPPAKLIAANLVPFTNGYRPAGAAVYRLVYETAGLNARLYRGIYFGLLLLNIWLLFCLARALTGSVEVGAFAALIGSFHPRLFDLYLNGGFIYDVLCTTFYLGALTWYLRERPPKRWSLAFFLLLVVLALNSKEMAVTLPITLFAYEAIYHRNFRGNAAVWLSALLVAGAVIGKLAFGTAFDDNPDYQLQFTPAAWLETTRIYLGELVFRPIPIGSIAAVLIFATVAAVAILLGSKTLAWCAVFVLIAPLPINFITPRSFSVMYLPLAGWAIYGAALLVLARRRFLERYGVGPGVLFLLAATILWYIQKPDAEKLATLASIDEGGSQIRQFRDQMLATHPTLPKGKVLLFLNDDFGPDTFTPNFVLRLQYRDPTLVIHRATVMRKPASLTDIDAADYVFDWLDGKLIEVRAPRQ